eukprot:6807439-Alexandrium_andersonii.AAC.1
MAYWLLDALRGLPAPHGPHARAGASGQRPLPRCAHPGSVPASCRGRGLATATRRRLQPAGCCAPQA